MKYKCWLSNIYGLWNGKKIIFRKNDISAEELYYMEENSIRKINGLTEKDIEIILKSRIEWEIDEKWGQFSMSGYSFISVEDKVYPERLRKIIEDTYVQKARIRLSWTHIVLLTHYPFYWEQKPKLFLGESSPRCFR